MNACFSDCDKPGQRILPLLVYICYPIGSATNLATLSHPLYNPRGCVS